MVAAVLLILCAGSVQAEASRPERPITPSATPRPSTEVRLPSTVIGYSVEGRPIVVYRAGNGPRVLMIVAGIHGGYEWNTSALVELMIEQIASDRGLVAEDVSLYLLPTLNPDGTQRSRGYEGRANANNVDLNRNFPYLWAENWPEEGCWHYLPISAGPHPLSEPETLALVRFVLANRVEALLSYHSAALGIFAGGQPATAASESLAEMVAAHTDYSYPPLDTGCQYTGQLADWAVANGIAAADVELSTHYNLDVDQNFAVLEAFLSWQPPNQGLPPIQWKARVLDPSYRD